MTEILIGIATISIVVILCLEVNYWQKECLILNKVISTQDKIIREQDVKISLLKEE